MKIMKQRQINQLLDKIAAVGRDTSGEKFIETIPKPMIIFEWLGQALREVDVLRRLLRLSEHAQHHRELSREEEDGPERLSMRHHREDNP